MREFILRLTSSLVGVALTYLQMYLSKKESKWLGLILPTISLIFPGTMILITKAYTFESANDIFYLIMLGVFYAFILLGIYTFYRLKRKK